jgi:hypothetical protein
MRPRKEKIDKYTREEKTNMTTRGEGEIGEGEGGGEDDCAFLVSFKVKDSNYFKLMEFFFQSSRIEIFSPDNSSTDSLMSGKAQYC